MEYLFFDDGAYIIAIAHIKSIRKNPSVVMGTYTVYLDDDTRLEISHEAYQKLYNLLRNQGMLFGMIKE